MSTIGSLILYYIFSNLIIIPELTAVNPPTGKLLFNPVVMSSSSNSVKMKSTELFQRFKFYRIFYLFIRHQNKNYFSPEYFHIWMLSVVWRKICQRVLNNIKYSSFVCTESIVILNVGDFYNFQEIIMRGGGRGACIIFKRLLMKCTQNKTKKMLIIRIQRSNNTY